MKRGSAGVSPGTSPLCSSRQSSALIMHCDIKTVLITGVTGAVGSYLAEYLVENRPEVALHGIARWHSTASPKNLAAVAGKVRVHECDLNDFSSVFSVLRRVNPNVIFHLAAQSSVGVSFASPQATLANNVAGAGNLFEAVRLAGIDPVILLSSSSEVYGRVDPKNIPVKEDCPHNPLSPYAVSRLAQDYLGWTYFAAYGMKIIRIRAFSYLNPRRADIFVSAFARQVARVEAGLQKELLHGNLDSVRALVDVRDIVEAYWLSILHCEPGEVYNIGGTTPISVGEFLNLLIARSKAPVPVRADPGLLRPADTTGLIPCVDKFVRATGWKPQYSLEDGVENLLTYWRAEARKERAC